jgi:hypothetical protein
MTVHCREGIHLQACICDTNGWANHNMSKDTKEALKSAEMAGFQSCHSSYSVSFSLWRDRFDRNGWNKKGSICYVMAFVKSYDENIVVFRSSFS